MSDPSVMKHLFMTISLPWSCLPSEWRGESSASSSLVSATNSFRVVLSLLLRFILTVGNASEKTKTHDLYKVFYK